ncbi:sulfur carrier protein ThiS [uncultured Pseudoteredinibacter sp.]|uniref:sulfur carrier protein ThiS n=1 Tax=uncultured Pseudoteredinibacter sp. TaxID=1641701 RepID=UPI002616BE79|nr:sulfur carrier protein ThiS [uncultured Pseudoteredinibacter sp.]
MNITLNGKNIEIAQYNTLNDFFSSLKEEGSALQVPKQFAVALNGNFVPREQYDKSSLQEGDELELLVPMQGG